MVLLHLASLMLDGYVHMGFDELLVPFATTYKPLSVAIGILAFYLLLAAYGSSLLLRWLPRRVWRSVHLGSYIAVLFIAIHAGFTGTDTGRVWYQITAGVLIGVTMVAAVLRVVLGRAAPAGSVTSRRGPDAAPERVAMPAMDVFGPAELEVRVRAHRMIARGIVRIDLESATDMALPMWRPGDHVSLNLPNGLVRQYSLCSDPADRSTWSIAVRLDPHSRGGSAWLHGHCAAGDVMRAVGPVSRFVLEPAHEYLFLAAGIGITPIWAMIASLPPGRRWRLIYLGRDRESMAFADEAEAQFGGRVQIWESARQGRYDIRVLAAEGRELVYVCGPEGVLAAAEKAFAADSLRVERFAGVDGAPEAGDVPFAVECRRSGVDLVVGAEQTLLQALEAKRLPVDASCREGVCGSCEIGVIAGTPIHRDLVWRTDGGQRPEVIYPCVSRARGTEALVLDL